MENTVLVQTKIKHYNLAINALLLHWDQQNKLKHLRVFRVKEFCQPKNSKILSFMIGPRYLSFIVMEVLISEIGYNLFNTKEKNFILKVD